MRQFNFGDVKQRLMQVQREIPTRLAKQAEKHFAESFQRGALDENRWQEVNRRIPGTNEYKYKRKGITLQRQRTSPILVQSGNLRRKVNRSIHTVRPNEIRLVVDLPYALAHNEGTDTIPARPFMKQTATLTSMQQTLITQNMDRIWRGQ